MGTSKTSAIFDSIFSEAPTRPFDTADVYCGFLPIIRAKSLLVSPFSFSISDIRRIILQR